MCLKILLVLILSPYFLGWYFKGNITRRISLVQPYLKNIIQHGQDILQGLVLGNLTHQIEESPGKLKPENPD